MGNAYPWQIGKRFLSYVGYYKLLGLLLLFLCFTPIANAESSEQAKNAELQPSITNYHFANLMAQQYVTLLKTNFASDETNLKYKNSKFLYQVAYNKFAVLKDFVILVADQRGYYSFSNNHEISKLGRDALFAYAQFCSAAKDALNSKENVKANSLYSPLSYEETSEITVRDITKTMLTDWIKKPKDTTAKTAQDNLIASLTSLITVYNAQSIDKAMFNTLATTLISNYQSIRYANVSGFEAWYNSNCSWASWDEIPPKKVES